MIRRDPNFAVDAKCLKSANTGRSTVPRKITETGRSLERPVPTFSFTRYSQDFQ